MHEVHESSLRPAETPLCAPVPIGGHAAPPSVSSAPSGRAGAPGDAPAGGTGGAGAGAGGGAPG
ncbi:hypothetical protein ACFWNU_13420, partial [Streptomyces sp. NPDC058427]